MVVRPEIVQDPADKRTQGPSWVMLVSTGTLRHLRVASSPKAQSQEQEMRVLRGPDWVGVPGS